MILISIPIISKNDSVNNWGTVERVHKYQPLFWPIVAFAPFLKKPLSFEIDKSYGLSLWPTFQQNTEVGISEIPISNGQTSIDI